MRRESHARFCERLEVKSLRSTHQGRFKSQALLDEAGLLTAMAYVDLNPVRAGIAATPQESDFTSIYRRIQEFEAVSHQEAGIDDARSGDLNKGICLMPFRSLDPKELEPMRSIPFSLESYLEVVNWTSRRIDGRQRVPADEALPPLLRLLRVDVDAWERAMRPRGNGFGRAIGRLDRLRLHAQTLGQAWIRGLREAELLYCA